MSLVDILAEVARIMPDPYCLNCGYCDVVWPGCPDHDPTATLTS